MREIYTAEYLLLDFNMELDSNVFTVSEHTTRQEATLARREYLKANPSIADRDLVKVKKLYKWLRDED